jgi:hypothetical protein
MKQYFKKLWILPALLFSAASMKAQLKELSLQEAIQIASKGKPPVTE